MHREVADSVTVTLPIHPLHGLALPFVREIRDRDGRRHLELEHPRGWVIRLPADWTDRGVSQTGLVVDGRIVYASATAMRRLSIEVAQLMDALDVTRGVLRAGSTLVAPEGTYNATSTPISPSHAATVGVGEHVGAAGASGDAGRPGASDTAVAIHGARR